MSQHTKLSQELRNIYKQLANEGVLHGLDERCKHHECDNNIVDVSALDSTAGPKKLRWCIYTLPQEKAARLSDLAAVQGFKLPASAAQIAAEEQVRQRSENFHRSLEALIKMDDRLDAMGKGQSRAAGAAHTPLQMHPDGETNKKAFLQRHRYELPADRARLFATTTPAWTDSGSMPNIVPTTSTEARIFHQEGTTTGAIAEFLGGDLSGHLPFAADTATSAIATPPVDDLAWAIPRTAEELADFDRLIAESEQTGRFVPAAEGEGIDAVMEGMNFDELEMDFDGVFDMPVDETFVPSGGGAEF